MDGTYDIFALIGKRMNWLCQRQEMLVDTIAAVHTPDWLPYDLNPVK